MAARRRDARGRFISAATYRRSRAASRAWAARKAREAAERQRRSAAAKRGWKTRREAPARRAGRIMRAAEERRQRIEGEPRTQEYVQAIRYKSPRGRQHFGTVQASIFAPPGTTKKALAESVNQALAGRSAQFEVRVIKWLSRR